MMGFLLNEKNSIRIQLTAIFSLISVISLGITLGICLSFLYALGDSTYTIADRSITSQTEKNVKQEAQEIVAAIAKELETIGESTALLTAKYSASLMDSLEFSTTEMRLKTPVTFNEYNFYDGCSYPSCPTDYGDLSDRS